MPDQLVIVESPTKAKTISRFLDKGYNVQSSYGHVRDLPSSKIGVDTEKDFTPDYQIIPKAKKRVTELKKLAKKSKGVILATDEDREGEAIAWHLMSALELTPSKTKRIVFHEITESAIKEALEHPRPLDMHLVNAQQSRRILDRLVGYELSPLLWKKLFRGLSAGRVQSVALKLIVDREAERDAFKPDEYWTIAANLETSDKQTLQASLYAVGDEALDKLSVKTAKEAQDIVRDLEKASFSIESVTVKDALKAAPAPLTTSSLVAESASRFGYSAAQTMRIAQQLYEGIEVGSKGQEGLITYMRTDSLNLAEEFLKKAGGFIEKEYGADYYHGSPRRFKTKAKVAQEAHEAIRPTDPARTPKSIKEHLDAKQYKIYDFVWRRTVASQMKEASVEQMNIKVAAKSKKSYTLSASGSRITFDGYLKVYPSKTEEQILPKLKEGALLTATDIDSEQHFTQPPPRYSEGSLVKALEKFGIGRPSTYAPIIMTLQLRKYLRKDKNRRFLPTEVGVKVTELLTTHFPDIVDVAFTATMEDNLDHIANGNGNWVKLLKTFYKPFHAAIKKKEKEISRRDFTQTPSDQTCEKCGKPMVIKLGRFGRFLACSGFPDCKTTKAIFNTIGMKCPTCLSSPDSSVRATPGEVVERYTKKGRNFFGCSRWPKCDFATWSRPTGELCPTCGGALVEGARGKVTCSKKCGYTVSTE